LANVLNGRLGDDTLQGLFGSDALLGGVGFDTYDLRLGEDPTTDTIIDSDGSFVTIFSDGSTNSPPEIFLTGNNEVTGGGSAVIATVSDFDGPLENLVVVVDGIAAEDFTIAATGDIVF